MSTCYSGQQVNFKGFLLFLITLIWSILITNCHFRKDSPGKLLLVSFDGFRWDYLSKVSGKTPNFDKFITNGGHARKGMKNCFMTKTLPNHFTLITGLYEESHGIIGNYMYDPAFNETFSFKNSTQCHESKWFDNGGEPIWVTNQLQGNDRRTGSLFWPGTYAAVKGVLPTRNIKYNEHLPNKTRVDMIIDWFTAEYPINLGLLYFSEPDGYGHQYGPESQEVMDMVIALDEIVGYILNKTEEKDLDDLNIIILSDHGMSNTPKADVINLDDYIHPKDYRIIDNDPVGLILPNEGKKETIYKALSQSSKDRGKFEVYYKEDVPPQYHFARNRRVQSIVIIMKDHYTYIYNTTTIKYSTNGTHGYNNSLQDMHPFFLAMGPAFKKRASVESFNNLDVYPLMCHILGLKPAPNNGTLDIVKELLKEEKQYTVVTFATYIGILVFIALVGGIFMMAACRQHRYMKRKQQYSLTSVPGGVNFSSVFQHESKLPLLSDSEEESTP
ncbi:hypothetical protein SNE40_018828 [Patella caerulea]|uniref:Uncharacterized protein n=2 Tax=Patella caerulea TaxID=87958 RepID=A0AAN8P8M0_PATCE